MIEDDRQLCEQCEYDITGIAPPGRLVRCPECGGDNRIGSTSFDAIHAPMPDWWVLGGYLGWPGPVWALFALLAYRSGDPAFITGIAVMGGVVFFVTCARAAMLAIDCSPPTRRSSAILWAVLWGLLGAIALTVLAGVAIFTFWVAARWLETLRGAAL